MRTPVLCPPPACSRFGFLWPLWPLWRPKLGSKPRERRGINMQCVLSAQGWDFGGGALGTFRSSDGGGSFEEANVGNTSMGPTRGFTSDETYVYKCTSNGVFRSGDNGAGWESGGYRAASNADPRYDRYCRPRMGGHTDGRFCERRPGHDLGRGGLDGLNVRCITAWEEVVFVGTIDEGLFKSRMGGASWEAINNGSTSNSFRAIEAHAGMVFAGGEIGTGVFRSQDMGASWGTAGRRIADGVLPGPLPRMGSGLWPVLLWRVFLPLRMAATLGWNSMRA